MLDALGGMLLLGGAYLLFGLKKATHRTDRDEHLHKQFLKKWGFILNIFGVLLMLLGSFFMFKDMADLKNKRDRNKLIEMIERKANEKNQKP